MSIDWLLLAKQKATLIDLCINGLLTKSQVEDLDGLVHLMDGIQDASTDGVFMLDGSKAGYIDENNDYVVDGDAPVPSGWTPGPKWKKRVNDVIDSADEYLVSGFTVIGNGELEALENAIKETHD